MTYLRVMKKRSPVRSAVTATGQRFVAPRTGFDSGVRVVQRTRSEVEVVIILDDVLRNIKYGSSITAVSSRRGWAGEKLPKVVSCIGRRPSETLSTE